MEKELMGIIIRDKFIANLRLRMHILEHGRCVIFFTVASPTRFSGYATEIPLLYLRIQARKLKQALLTG